MTHTRNTTRSTYQVELNTTDSSSHDHAVSIRHSHVDSKLTFHYPVDLSRIKPEKDFLNEFDELATAAHNNHIRIDNVTSPPITIDEYSAYCKKHDWQFVSQFKMRLTNIKSPEIEHYPPYSAQHRPKKRFLSFSEMITPKDFEKTKIKKRNEVPEDDPFANTSSSVHPHAMRGEIGSTKKRKPEHPPADICSSTKCQRTDHHTQIVEHTVPVKMPSPSHSSHSHFSYSTANQHQLPFFSQHNKEMNQPRGSVSDDGDAPTYPFLDKIFG